jgi:hypothetical protein
MNCSLSEVDLGHSSPSFSTHLLLLGLSVIVSGPYASGTMPSRVSTPYELKVQVKQESVASLRRSKPFAMEVMFVVPATTDEASATDTFEIILIATDGVITLDAGKPFVHSDRAKTRNSVAIRVPAGDIKQSKFHRSSFSFTTKSSLISKVEAVLYFNGREVDRSSALISFDRVGKGRPEQQAGEIMREHRDRLRTETLPEAGYVIPDSSGETSGR